MGNVDEPRAWGTEVSGFVRTSTADALLDGLTLVATMPGAGDRCREIQRFMTKYVKVLAGHDVMELLDSTTETSVEVNKLLHCLQNVNCQDLPQPEFLDVAYKCLYNSMRMMSAKASWS